MASAGNSEESCSDEKALVKVRGIFARHLWAEGLSMPGMAFERRFLTSVVLG